jgi:hypothetical protein
MLALAPACVMEHGGGWDEPIPALGAAGPLPGSADPVDDGEPSPQPGEGEVLHPDKQPGADDGDRPDRGEHDDPAPGDGDDDVTEPEPAPYKLSTRHNLNWKRYRAVEEDLMRGLALDRDALCNELGSYRCVDQVHLSPLGGNEPFDSAQHIPVHAPTATTAIALDRVVLSACLKRVSLDAAGTPVVFTALNLDASSLTTSQDQAAVDATTQALFRRLHSRDAELEELDVARALAFDGAPLDGRSFAVALCYAVGTTAESFFF